VTVSQKCFAMFRICSSALIYLRNFGFVKYMRSKYGCTCTLALKVLRNLTIELKIFTYYLFPNILKYKSSNKISVDMLFYTAFLS